MQNGSRHFIFGYGVCHGYMKHGAQELFDCTTSSRFANGQTRCGSEGAKIVTARVLRIAQDLVAETVLAGALGPEGAARASLLERVVRREMAPHACARALLAQAASRASTGS